MKNMVTLKWKSLLETPAGTDTCSRPTRRPLHPHCPTARPTVSAHTAALVFTEPGSGMKTSGLSQGPHSPSNARQPHNSQRPRWVN